MNSKLRWEKRMEGRHGVLRSFYRHLLELRQRVPQMVSKKNLTVQAITTKKVLIWQRMQGLDPMYCLMNFSDRDEQFMLRTRESSCRKVLDSADVRWEGPGAQLPEAVCDRQEVGMPRRSIALYCLSQPEVSADRIATAAHVSIVEEI
jgi:maltooligosyltrehalose trehalohydrolase